MLFYELFRNPSCTHYVEVKSIVDDFIGRIVTDLQLVVHIVRHASHVVSGQAILTILVAHC
jgi:hypothetical protein